MQSMDSKHFAAPKRAEKYSVDGLKWDDIPSEIIINYSIFLIYKITAQIFDIF